MRRGLRWLGLGIAALVAVFVAALALVDTGIGHRWVTERIATVHTANGLRFAIGRIDGSLYGKARLTDVRVYDLDGLLLQAPSVDLDWRPWAWLRHRLVIKRLAVGQAVLFHAPHTRANPQRGPILPDFDIAIDDLRVDRLVPVPDAGDPTLGEVAALARASRDLSAAGPAAAKPPACRR